MSNPPTQPRHLTHAIHEWIAAAQDKVDTGSFTRDDLRELATLITDGVPRQRLLYLHTSSPSVQSRVMASYAVEPVPHGAGVELTPEPTFDYQSVHDAMIDGWRVVRFPEYAATVQDREIDIQGYEFILEKQEVYRD